MKGDMVIDVEDEKGKRTKKTIKPVKEIPFIPSAYQLDVDRNTIRKTPALKDFHEFLKVQTDVGHITRQETVSMVPPAALSVSPHHHVLDLCAAPGSETTQILEQISQIPPGQSEPTGLDVANEADTRQLPLLTVGWRRLPVGLDPKAEACLLQGAADNEGPAVVGVGGPYSYVFGAARAVPRMTPEALFFRETLHAPV
mmetsp:Transcript_14142/g.25918  ORF Transcript_14142/g.25918 Transcript_14142/m.25918 type:complete len:199 (+) Transcript_14142:123-719(+)|eukprot:CAMPEP_0182505340 /NCGR_PEP_ID=MMETSP1321-20130603/19070_1 /TAXON_ID=91990 /ORGANISM="Bolidomonas sp., Strain RCC1657" /LENGTH=198 /DNA_ID=CAMNT_0024710867 /DNA_START=45 /DNA_END=641 /DNA_ORIENTATION=-